MINNKRVLVYLDKKRLAPKGGPHAVGYFYHQEMLKREDETLEFIDLPEKHVKFKEREQSILKFLPGFLKNLYKNLRQINAVKRLLESEPYDSGINLSEYSLVLFHQADHMWRERKQLENYQGIVVFQSHSPIPFGKEVCTDISKMIEIGVKDLHEKYDKVDRYAFDRADYLIFPCEEAEEPYHDTWPYYSIVKKNKIGRFNYVLTGITPAVPKRTRDDIFSELAIPKDDFVISYVGRHNSVKGYDILKQIAGSFFENYSDSWVISAGKEEPFTRLEHDHWKEIGWTNDAHSYISASDVFILPNRVTYFDIVMLEVLSLGKIVIASNTGGNKYFKKAGVKGVFLYDTVEEAVELLNMIKSMPLGERISLGQANKEYFDQHLTVSTMYDRYIEVLSSLLS